MTFVGTDKSLKSCSSTQGVEPVFLVLVIPLKRNRLWLVVVIAELGGSALGSRQAKLDNIGPLGTEAGLTIAKVEPPKTPEPLIKAKSANVVPGPLE